MCTVEDMLPPTNLKFGSETTVRKPKLYSCAHMYVLAFQELSENIIFQGRYGEQHSRLLPKFYAVKTSDL
jgi:hypothetical protein